MAGAAEGLKGEVSCEGQASLAPDKGESHADVPPRFEWMHLGSGGEGPCWAMVVLWKVQTLSLVTRLGSSDKGVKKRQCFIPVEVLHQLLTLEAVLPRTEFREAPNTWMEKNHTSFSPAEKLHFLRL